MAAKKRKKSRRFVTAMDDSGGHAALLHPDGRRILTDSQPFVGVGSVTMREELVPFFVARWNRLREKIGRELGLANPPPIHARWMWGAQRADKHKNPYVNATNEQAAEWLTEAATILRDYQRHRNEFGLFVGYLSRAEMQDWFEPYYTDPDFEAERIFLRSRAIPLGLYKEFHRATAYPLFRVLPLALVSEYQSMTRVGGTSLSVLLDNFTGADGVKAEDVSRAVRDLAQLDKVESLDVVDSYANSALVQAADVMAWAGNRLATKNHLGDPDAPFRARFDPLLQEARTVSDTRVLGGVKLPSGVGMTTLCVPYALARSAVHKKHPEFVDRMFVSVEEFHDRAITALETGKKGVHVLTAEGQAMAEAYLLASKK